MPGAAMLNSEQVPLDGKCTLELRLSRELQAAYECHLVEQAHSSRRFINRIALVCEREACSGPAIAKALHELGDADEGSTDGLRYVAAKKDQTYVTQNEQCLHQVVSSSAPGGRSSQQYPLALESIKLDSPSPEHSQEPKRPNLQRKATDTFQDVQDEDMEQMRHLFDIPKCSFIDAGGKIHHIPSDFEAIVGPILRHMYESLSHSWCLPMQGGCFLKFTQSMFFKIMGALVILANFFFIICQTDYAVLAEINKYEQTEANWMKIAEVVFTSYYMFELACLIVAQRKDFFLGPEMSWNWFDFIIVLTGALELVMTSLGGSMANLSFLRVLRFFKMSRVLRMFCALRMVKDVKVMVDALTGSFIIFIFGCMLLAMFLSVFSIFFVQGMATFLEGEVNLDVALRESIIADFGSVATAMRSLFMSATGGDDWSKYHNTIKVLGPVYDYLYLFFMAFALIAFFNVITGVFAEKAMSLASPAMDEMTSRRHGKEVKDAEELVQLLDRVLANDGSGTISINEFGDLLSHPEVVAFFEVRGLKATTAHRFFTQLLEMNQTDRIDVGAFVSACVKLDGAASSIDVHVISVEMKTVLMQQHMLHNTLKDNLRRITASVEGQLSEFRRAAPRCPALESPPPPAASAPSLAPSTPPAAPLLASNIEAAQQGQHVLSYPALRQPSTEAAPAFAIMPAFVAGPSPPEKDSLPCLFSGLPESGHTVFGPPIVMGHAVFGTPIEDPRASGTSVIKAATAKLVKATGDECADALLSSCCKGVGAQEEEGTSLTSTTGSYHGSGFGTTNGSGQSQGGDESTRHITL